MFRAFCPQPKVGAVPAMHRGHRVILPMSLCVLSLLFAIPTNLMAQSCPHGWPSSYSLPSSGFLCPPTITMGDSDLCLTISDGPNGYSFDTLVGTSSGTMTFEETEIITIEVEDSNGVSTELTPADFQQRAVFDFGHVVFMRWWDPSGISGNLSITLRIWWRSGEFRFDAKVWNSTANALSRVNYPRYRLEPLNPLPASDVLVLPVLGGSAIIDPQINVPGFRLPNPGASYQMLCHFDRLQRRSLYLQSKDPWGTPKDYNILSLGTSTQYSVTHYPVNNQSPGSDYYPQYTTALTALSGTWYDAAIRYRDWARWMPWSCRGPIEFSSDFSSRMRDIKLHGLQYPDHTVGFDQFDRFVHDADRVNSYLGLSGSESMYLWSDWHTKVFNVELPDLDSAVPGTDSAVQLAHSLGINILPYVAVDYWSSSSDAWAETDMTPYLWINADGISPDFLLGPSLDQPHFKPNPHWSVVRNAKADIITDVLNVLPTQNWAGIYLDTWSGNPAELDYNPNLYFKGGTPQWNIGRIREGIQFRPLIKGPDNDNIVASEIINEQVIPDLDVFHYNPFDTGTIQLPVWETIYHGWIMTSNLSPTVPQNAALVPSMLGTLQYDYHLGKVMGISNFFGDSRNFIEPNLTENVGIEIFDYLAALMAVEDHARKYRIFGERLRPLDSSISASMESLAYFVTGPPPATTSVWRASDGDTGILVTNSSATAQTLTLNINFDDLGLSGNYTIYLCQGGIRIPLLPVSASFSIPIPVAPMSATVYEIVLDP